MNWIELKALSQLRLEGNVPINQTLSESSIINYLTNSLEVLEKTSRKLIVLNGYFEIYDMKYAASFEMYHQFLSQNNLLKPQTRFDLTDIDRLMNISNGMSSGDLHDLRTQIIECDESLRGVSLMFFKNEKYLLGKPSLIDALKQILQVDHFSIEKDQQYIYKLECYNPKLIVLCENLDFLTKPNTPRKHGIELWYAGGRNIQKLQYGSHRGLPLYYSCDWDHDGLSIYSSVKNIFPDIKLLTPNGIPRDIDETGHRSYWRERNNPNYLSGVHPGLLSEDQQTLLKVIIVKNQWIVEESNNLVSMLSGRL